MTKVNLECQKFRNGLGWWKDWHGWWCPNKSHFFEGIWIWLKSTIDLANEKSGLGDICPKNSSFFEGIKIWLAKRECQHSQLWEHHCIVSLKTEPKTAKMNLAWQNLVDGKAGTCVKQKPKWPKWTLHDWTWLMESMAWVPQEKLAFLEALEFDSRSQLYRISRKENAK